MIQAHVAHVASALHRSVFQDKLAHGIMFTARGQSFEDELTDGSRLHELE